MRLRYVDKDAVKRALIKEYNITKTKEIDNMLDYLLDVLDSSKITYKTHNYDTMQYEDVVEISLDYVANEVRDSIEVEDE